MRQSAYVVPARRSSRGVVAVLAVLLTVVGGVLALTAGVAQALAPTDPVTQTVPVAGSSTGGGLLLFNDISRNPSCSVTRNLLNQSGLDLDVRILDAGGAQLDRRQLTPGEQSTVSIDHTVVTVPMFIQVNGGPSVELAQIGPFAPCEIQETTTTTAPTTTAPTTTAATTTTTAPPTTTTEPPSTTTTEPPTTTSTAPPVTSAPTTTLPASTTTVSVLGTVVVRGTGTLPITGARPGRQLALGLAVMASGVVLLVASRRRAVARRPSLG